MPRYRSSTQRRSASPKLLACSFDRGFHSPDNQAALGDRLDLNAIPVKGRRPARRRAIEEQPDIAEARQQHPAVEAAINNLDQRGLDRVRTHGKAGFARTVALSILAANVHRVGLLIRARERERLKRLQRRAARVHRGAAPVQPGTGCPRLVVTNSRKHRGKWLEITVPATPTPECASLTSSRKEIRQQGQARS